MSKLRSRSQEYTIWESSNQGGKTQQEGGQIIYTQEVTSGEETGGGTAGTNLRETRQGKQN